MHSVVRKPNVSVEAEVMSTLSKLQRALSLSTLQPTPFNCRPPSLFAFPSLYRKPKNHDGRHTPQTKRCAHSTTSLRSSQASSSHNTHNHSRQSNAPRPLLYVTKPLDLRIRNRATTVLTLSPRRLRRPRARHLRPDHGTPPLQTPQHLRNLLQHPTRKTPRSPTKRRHPSPNRHPTPHQLPRR